MPLDQKNWSLFKVVFTKKKSLRRECKRLETIEGLSYLFISPRNVGLPQKIQTEHTDTLNYDQAKIK